jgi:DNA-binding CsgD family transcriptional regulator
MVAGQDLTVPVDCPLTPREWEVVSLLADGLRLKEIGFRLGKKAATVEKQAESARLRLGVKTNERLVAECYEQGWRTAPVRQEDEEWPEITPAQRAYLNEFDRMLLTPSGSEAERRSLGAMRYMLGAMCLEKGIRVPGTNEPLRVPLALAA